ncbi:Uncharacterised protein [Listeria fleischmannii subsp. fleischmannii]|uniref:Uncharacterized protein n=1 Tax=Listeria fleischmannii subsp. fleischmannii TaxID=1671902 RepID=A0A2X3ITV2_9LIST|nr:Uncharacterised protein [Listeria fleischmannii subsp. fleischmannii]
MTFKRDAIPYLEAQNRLMSQIEELEEERISLYSSKGRVLSRDIVAPFDFLIFAVQATMVLRLLKVMTTFIRLTLKWWRRFLAGKLTKKHLNQVKRSEL